MMNLPLKALVFVSCQPVVRFLKAPNYFGSILSDRSDGDSYLLASQSEEVGHGPKGILVAVINQSEHCIHSLVFSEKISPRNILLF